MGIEIGMFILYVSIIALGVIVIDYVCELIADYFRQKREIRIAAHIDYELPRLMEKTSDMSLDMIQRINQRLFEQFSGEEKEEP